VTRLPAPLQPVWPLAKRLHRFTSLLSGMAFRRVSFLCGRRGVPRRASSRSALTAEAEPGSVVLHRAGEAEAIDRALPTGSPRHHPVYAAAASFVVPAPFVLDLADGIVAGDFGAHITQAQSLDFETSPYFGVADWREHPVFLRPTLPRTEHVAGTVVSLATRGGGNSYYHFLLDVLPRWGIVERVLPGTQPDALYLPTQARYHRELLALTGLDQHTIIPSGKRRAVRADRLLVPSQPNPEEVAPRWAVDWLRRQLPPENTADKPSRIFVTRGNGRNTRRLVQEPEVWPLLEQRGFVRIDPGAMSVRDQIDHFAAADVIVGIHGAALTNLLFAKAGVKVLELFQSTYVKHCFWAITDDIDGSTYRYLISGEPPPPGKDLLGIQTDIEVEPEVVIAAVDDLLAS